MKRAIAILISVTFVIGTIGCATVKMESEVNKPVSMTNMRGTTVREFSINQKAIWLFWGMIPLSTIPELDDVVAPHVADRAGVQNLKITTTNGFVGAVVTTLTLGIITMQSVKIAGEVYDQ